MAEGSQHFTATIVCRDESRPTTLPIPLQRPCGTQILGNASTVVLRPAPQRSRKECPRSAPSRRLQLGMMSLPAAGSPRLRCRMRRPRRARRPSLTEFHVLSDDRVDRLVLHGSRESARDVRWDSLDNRWDDSQVGRLVVSHVNRESLHRALDYRRPARNCQASPPKTTPVR